MRLFNTHFVQNLRKISGDYLRGFYGFFVGLFQERNVDIFLTTWGESDTILITIVRQTRLKFPVKTQWVSRLEFNKLSNDIIHTYLDHIRETKEQAHTPGE